MILVIFATLITLTIAVIAVLYKPQHGYQRLLVEWKNDFKTFFPTVFSNLEDIVLQNFNRVSLYKQSSKIAVLIGGNGGIGVHVLKKLVVCEMTIVLGVRNLEASRKSVEKYLGNSLDGAKVLFEKCDTGDNKSVRNFAKKVQKKFSAIHLLINNAEISLVPYKKTKDGFESQMAVNFLGHALLTHLLMPQLIAGSNENQAKNARIVNVTSCANESGEIDYDDFNKVKYYHAGLQNSNSKLAQVLFTCHLETMCKENGLKVQSHCANPGIVDTEIFQNYSGFGLLPFLRRLMFKTPESGARSIVYAAIAPEIEGISSPYISNCRAMKANKLTDEKDECKKFFNFTCDLLQIEHFGEKQNKS